MILPLQQGNLTLNVSQGNWLFDENNSVADITCWAILTDSHGVRINNAPIAFTTSRAAFWWRDYSTDRLIGFEEIPAIKYSGVVDRQNNEPPGTATVYLIGEGEDFFFGNELETQVEIQAEVDGYDIQADPEFVIIRQR